MRPTKVELAHCIFVLFPHSLHICFLFTFVGNIAHSDAVIQSILLRCCVWKLYGEGSLMLSYEGFNHIHYCPSELPLAKGMLEGGQSSSPDSTMHTCTSSLTDQPLTIGSGYPTGDIRTPSIPQPYQPYNASQLDSRMDDEELLKHPTKGLFLN